MTSEERSAKQAKVRALAEEVMVEYFQKNPDKLRDHVRAWMAYDWVHTLVNTVEAHVPPDQLKERLGFDIAEIR